MGRGLITAQVQLYHTGTLDGLPVILVQVLDLSDGLDEDHTGQAVFTHGGQLLLEIRDHANVCKLIQDETYRDRQRELVCLCRMLVQRGEHLGVHHVDQK